MANLHKIQNMRNQPVRTDKIVAGSRVEFAMAAEEVQEFFDGEIGPTMTEQLEVGIFKIIETTTGTPPSVSIGVTPDQKDALNGANSPDASNPLATVGDLVGYDEQVTRLIFVDKNRTDTYTENGSIDRPFKTIAGAVGVAVAGSTIVVLGGDYSEAVTLPNNVNLFGFGVGITSITGNLATGSQNCHLRDFSLHGDIAINGKSSVMNVYCTGTVTTAADCQTWNFTIKPSSAAAKALVSSGGLVTFDVCTLESSGNVETVDHTAGKLVFNSVQLNGDEATKPVVKSTGGMLVVETSFVVNAGGGDSVSCDNGASTSPNAIIDSIIAGNVEAGTAATIAADIYGTGQVNGSAIVPKVTGSN